MAMNPAAMIKLMTMRQKFNNNHPKVESFLQKVLFSGLPEGTVIETTLTKPGTDPVTCNMKVTPDDLEMMNELKNLQN